MGAMKLKEVLHMNGGVGENSYAQNSSLQEKAILKVKPMVEEAILDMYCTTVPKVVVIADLGCSSGPNTFLVVSEIINVVNQKCHFLQRSLPEFQVFLNDLPGNDFNSIFKSLPTFYGNRRKEKGEDFGSCFIAGAPGSFYERIFPSNSLHFVHSSYSTHWLSQVPLGLESKEGMPLNKGKIYISKTSPPCVSEAYLQQFKKDFALLLKLRSQEMVDGGHMVLTFLGRTNTDPASKEGSYGWEVLGEALNHMVSKGIIQEEKLDSFNLPFYAPSFAEVEEVIEREGSFIVTRMENFKLNFDGSDENDYYDYNNSSQRATNMTRAASESMLISHFGVDLMDDLFDIYRQIMEVQLSQEKLTNTNLVISMKKE